MEESGPPARNLRQQARKFYTAGGEVRHSAPDATAAHKPAPGKTTVKRPTLSTSESSSSDTEEGMEDSEKPTSQYATPLEDRLGPQAPTLDLDNPIPMPTETSMVPIMSSVVPMLSQDNVVLLGAPTSRRSAPAARGKPRGGVTTKSRSRQEVQAASSLRRLQMEYANQEKALTGKRKPGRPQKATTASRVATPPLTVGPTTTQPEPRADEWTDDGLEEFIEQRMKAQPVTRTVQQPSVAPMPPAPQTVAPTTRTTQHVGQSPLASLRMSPWSEDGSELARARTPSPERPRPTMTTMPLEPTQQREPYLMETGWTLNLNPPGQARTSSVESMDIGPPERGRTNAADDAHPTERGSAMDVDTARRLTNTTTAARPSSLFKETARTVAPKVVAPTTQPRVAATDRRPYPNVDNGRSPSRHIPWPESHADWVARKKPATESWDDQVAGMVQKENDRVVQRRLEQQAQQVRERQRLLDRCQTEIDADNARAARHEEVQRQYEERQGTTGWTDAQWDHLFQEERARADRDHQEDDREARRHLEHEQRHAGIPIEDREEDHDPWGAAPEERHRRVMAQEERQRLIAVRPPMPIHPNYLPNERRPRRPPVERPPPVRKQRRDYDDDGDDDDDEPPRRPRMDNYPRRDGPPPPPPPGDGGHGNGGDPPPQGPPSHHEDYDDDTGSPSRHHPRDSRTQDNYRSVSVATGASLARRRALRLKVEWPVFRGVPGEDAQLFLTKFADAAYAMGLDESEMVGVLCTQCLKDNAYAWYLALATATDRIRYLESTPWSEFRTAFDRRWTGATVGQMAFARRDALRHTGSMAEYVRAYQEVDAITASRSSMYDRLEKFLLHLKPEAREFVSLANVKTLDQAYDYAMRFAAAREPRPTTSVSQSRRTEVHDTELGQVANMDEERHADLITALQELGLYGTEHRPTNGPRRTFPPTRGRGRGGPMTAEKKQDLERRLCFKCHKAGHFASACPTTKS